MGPEAILTVGGSPSAGREDALGEQALTRQAREVHEPWLVKYPTHAATMTGTARAASDGRSTPSGPVKTYKRITLTAPERALFRTLGAMFTKTPY